MIRDVRSAAGLRVAIVGLGRMGVRHLQAVNSLGMTVCGMADVSKAALSAACQAYGVEPEISFIDADAMLATARPEAVVVATTAPSHASLVLKAAARGAKYVLCEKPMAVSLAEASAMSDACESRGIALAINHQMQFMAKYSDVKRLIGSDELGPLVSVLVAGANFGLAMNASHFFEMLRYMTGSEVNSVSAWFDDEILPNPRGPEFEDRSGRLLARSASGVVMYVDFSVNAGYGVQTTYICRHGQILVDELNGTMRVVARQAQLRDLPTTRYGLPADISQSEIDPGDALAATVSVWNALFAGRPYPNAAAGNHAMRCLVAAHLSNESGGRPVSTDVALLPIERRFPWA